MKMNKKKALSLALVIALIAILSFSSLAWFNASQEVTNTFQIASSGSGDGTEGGADEIFSVDVWEEDDNDDDKNNFDENVNTKGEDGTVKDEYKDQNGKHFNNILPGGSYSKRPYVENTGSYNQWIRVSISVSEGAAWKSILREGDNLRKQFEGLNANLVYDTAVYNGDDEYVYYYYYNAQLKPGEEIMVFNNFTIPTYLTQDDMAKIQHKDFQVKIHADALQVENLPNDPTTAKAAFESVGWTIDQTAPTK